MLAWMLGWGLLAWAFLLAGWTFMAVASRLRRGHRPNRTEAFSMTAATLLLTVAVLHHPLGGSGSGQA